MTQFSLKNKCLTKITDIHQRLQSIINVSLTSDRNNSVASRSHPHSNDVANPSVHHEMLSSTAEISFQLTLNLCALCMRGGKRLWNDIQASERLFESSKWGKMCFQDKFNSEILLGKCRVVLGCPCSAPFAIFISGLVRRWRFWRIKRQPSGVNEKGIGHVGLLYMAKDN